MLTPSAETVLAQCFDWASHHPVYRDRFAPGQTWHDAPCLDKAALLAALARLDLCAETRGLYLVRSGGSSHAPLIFPVDIAENHAQRSALAQALTHAGLFPAGSIGLNIFGYSDLYRSAAIIDDLLERCDATTLAMSAHASYTDMIAIAQRFKPTHVLGTPSKLRQLADALEHRNEHLDIPVLVYAGEELRPTVRAALQARLGVAQVASLYGAAETGVWAWCMPTDPAAHFNVLPGVVVEILNPAADGFGAVVVSNGFRRRYPVFRYRLGDRGRLVDHAGGQCLVLAGRDACSFQFDELTYDLAPFIELTAGFECMQLQLHSSADGRDQLQVLLVPGARALADATHLTHIRQALMAKIAHEPGSIEVLLTDSEHLHHDPHTAKIPVLVDLRR